MESPPPEAPRFTQLELWARQLGFDDLGVAPVALPGAAESLDEWTDRGYAGGMEWLTRNRDVRLDPTTRFPWARSILVLRMSYAGVRQLPGLSRHVSVYAQADDYHDILLPRLKQLAERSHGGARWHAYVDTGPLLERQLAAAAGLGWLGKNTLLLSAAGGSYAFLGVIVSELEIEGPAREAQGSCGSCNACQPACPTNAFVEPGVLDARRCISYLTIEHRGPIQRELRPAMGEWIFGCDLCQSACPFNRSAGAAQPPAEFSRSLLRELDLLDLLRMDEEEFRRVYRKTPLWRPRRTGLLRNALIVAANAGRFDCSEEMVALLRDDSEILRECASWSLAALRRAWRERLRWAGEAKEAPDWAGIRSAMESACGAETVDWARAGMREDLAAILD